MGVRRVAGIAGPEERAAPERGLRPNLDVREAGPAVADPAGTPTVVSWLRLASRMDAPPKTTIPPRGVVAVCQEGVNS